MVSSFGFIVSVIIFYKERRVLGKRVDNSAAKLIAAVFAVGNTLCVQSLALFVTSCFAVIVIEIAVGIYSAHIVHCGRNSRLYTGVDSGSIKSKPSPAANADYAYAFRIDIFLQRQEVHRRLKVLGIYVGRSHISRSAAALSRKGRVKGYS